MKPFTFLLTPLLLLNLLSAQEHQQNRGFTVTQIALDAKQAQQQKERRYLLKKYHTHLASLQSNKRDTQQ